MPSAVTIREHGRLTSGSVTEPSLYEASISEADFDWLCKLSSSFRSGGAPLVQVDDRKWLRLDNYVGFLETPDGTCIEILPKHCQGEDTAFSSRTLLRKMIQRALNLPTREVGPADLSLFDAPLSEWIIQQFLAALDHIIKRGLRFDYVRIEEEQRFLRGQLDITKQSRQPPGKAHYFQIRHDVFVPDRPENRLLKTALELVSKHTKEASNWRLSHELLGLMGEVPASGAIGDDFKRWSTDRLMTHYDAIRPWCELILKRQMPLAISGDWRGISFLFPMERLFESYVEQCLRNALPVDARLIPQSTSRYLCQHDGRNFFQLRPDLLVSQGGKRWVLDTKWKEIDSSDVEHNYGLAQSDFYQLFAYGSKYLDGVGNLVLIYPKTDRFDSSLPVFEFNDDLRLWAMPFDLDNEVLVETEPSILPAVWPKNALEESKANNLGLSGPGRIKSHMRNA